MSPKAAVMKRVGDRSILRPHESATAADRAPSTALKAQLSKEARLLCACARTEIDAAARATIEKLLAEDLNWTNAIRSGRWHGVMPLVCNNLLTQFSERLDAEIVARLKALAGYHARQGLLQAMELVRIHRLLGAKGIDMLPLKGPTLAVLAYGNPALREFCDLDVMVPKPDVAAALALLCTNGYHLAAEPTWWEKLPTPISRRKDYGLLHDTTGVQVELHWRLSGSHFDLPLETKRLWAERERVALAAGDVKTLGLVDLLLYVCMHGSRHGWVRLIWIADVAEMVRRREDLDWKEVWSRARRFGAERSLALGLRLAHELLDLALPADVERRIYEDRALDPLVKLVGEHLFWSEGGTIDIGFWRRYHLHAKERLQDRLRLRLHYGWRYARLAVSPNERDFAVASLPENLRFLYYLVRPFRLVGDYAIGPARRAIERLGGRSGGDA